MGTRGRRRWWPLPVSLWLSVALSSSGAATAAGAPTASFLLPYPAGTSYAVLQGDHGLPSHQADEAFAWDFAMPLGSAVVATAPGLVVEVDDSLAKAGVDAAEIATTANSIVVDLGAARFAVYGHLLRGSALVREGDAVQRGQELGRVGPSGTLSEPHLHFAVVDHCGRTQPIHFADVRDGMPRAGINYRSGNVATGPSAGRGAPPPLSVLPRDAFVDNGVELLVDLPAHLWQAGNTLEVRGRSIAPQLAVVAFIMDRKGGTAITEAKAQPGEDGHFALELPLPPTLRGRRAFAITLSRPDGIFGSSFSVPIVVR